MYNKNIFMYNIILLTLTGKKDLNDEISVNL